MSEFYINTETIMRQSGRLAEVSDSVRSVQRSVANVAVGLAGVGLGAVVPSIAAVELRLVRHMGKTNSLSTALSGVMVKYAAAESDIMGIPLIFSHDLQKIAGQIVDITLGNVPGLKIPLIGLLAFSNGNICSYEEKIKCVLLPFLKSYTSTFRDLKIDFEHGSITFGKEELSIGFKGKQAIKSIEKFVCHDIEEQKNWVDTVRREYYVDKELHQEYKENFRPASTVKSLQAEVKKSVSAWEAQGGLAWENGSVSGKVSALNAEAHATAYAGFISEDGKFAPGVGAEVGASASLFEASGTLRSGNDYFGSYVKGKVEVCKVGAGASVSAGLYDKDGKFNPSLGAGVKAEAILGQASASVGQRVMGTDIGVTGSIGYGAGVHANVGFQNGKVSVDAGAYLGVGGSVSLELDFTDTYDTIVSACNEVSNFAGAAYNTVSDVAGGLYDATTNFAGEVYDAASDFAGEVWDTITFWN